MALNGNPKIYISDVSFDESVYVRGDNKWMASTLYNKAKVDKLKPFDYPLAAFNMLGVDTPFDLSNLKSFIDSCDFCKKSNILSVYSGVTHCLDSA